MLILHTQRLYLHTNASSKFLPKATWPWLDIKCAEYATFGTEELSKNVIKALENRSACLMSNHGQVAFGKNLDDAFELAQEIENICHQYTIALKLGKPKILSFEEMKKVLDKAKNYKKG